MDEEDKRNKEFLIVGQAFLHTGISKIEDLIQNYIKRLNNTTILIP